MADAPPNHTATSRHQRYAAEDVFAVALILTGFWMSAHAQFYWALDIDHLRPVALGVPVTTDAFAPTPASCTSSGTPTAWPCGA